VHRWLFVVVAGCSFTPPDEADPGDSDGGSTDPIAAGCREPGTVLCLDFETEVDPMNQALDASGFAHHAVATGVLSTGSDVASNPVDTRAVEFDGTTSELRIPDSPQLNLRGPLTMEMWIAPRLPSLPLTARTLLDASGQYRMTLASDFDLECAITGPDGEISSDTKVPADGRWHHVACTWEPADRGTLRIYIDGALDDCETDTGTIMERPGPTTIGARADGAQHFDGYLDNVHLYDRALAPAELCRIAGGTTCNAACPVDD
jgi:hypothetical protein